MIKGLDCPVSAGGRAGQSFADAEPDVEAAAEFAADSPPLGDCSLDEPPLDEPPLDEPLLDEPPLDEPLPGDEPPVEPLDAGGFPVGLAEGLLAGGLDGDGEDAGGFEGLTGGLGESVGLDRPRRRLARRRFARRRRVGARVVGGRRRIEVRAPVTPSTEP